MCDRIGDCLNIRGATQHRDVDQEHEDEFILKHLKAHIRTRCLLVENEKCRRERIVAELILAAISKYLQQVVR